MGALASCQEPMKRLFLSSLSSGSSIRDRAQILVGTTRINSLPWLAFALGHHIQQLCRTFCSRRKDARPQLPQEQQLRAPSRSKTSIWVRNNWQILQKVVRCQVDPLPQGHCPAIVEYWLYMSCFIVLCLLESNPFKMSLNLLKLMN